MKTRILKRIFDIISSLGGIVLLFPVYAIVAAAIWIEGMLDPAARGPVINPEYRISKGKRFEQYKFRTIKAEYFKELQSDRNTKTQSVIHLKCGAATRVGAFLAKYYLDELPQLFNILKSDMSMVGPRPQPVTAFFSGREEFRALGEIKGGLCGLCQACKRNRKLHMALLDAYNSKKNHPKLRYLDDIYLANYNNFSDMQMLIYDVKVMVMTLRVNIQAEGMHQHLLEKFQSKK